MTARSTMARRIGPIFVQLFAQTESPMTGTYMRAQDHILEGPGSELLEDPKVAELYLGGTARIDRAEA